MRGEVQDVNAYPTDGIHKEIEHQHPRKKECHRVLFEGNGRNGFSLHKTRLTYGTQHIPGRRFKGSNRCLQHRHQFTGKRGYKIAGTINFRFHNYFLCVFLCSIVH
jgi:hypothetical protein